VWAGGIGIFYLKLDLEFTLSIYMFACMAEKIVKVPDIEASAIKRLTVTEIGIIQEAANGLISKEIATKLGISHKTVEVHRHNVMKKLGAKNFLQVVLALYKKNIIR
jgi:DNA-binding NarL/FixJ family response regulator